MFAISIPAIERLIPARVEYNLSRCASVPPQKYWKISLIQTSEPYGLNGNTSLELKWARAKMSGIECLKRLDFPVPFPDLPLRLCGFDVSREMAHDKLGLPNMTAWIDGLGNCDLWGISKCIGTAAFEFQILWDAFASAHAFLIVAWQVQTSGECGLVLMWLVCVGGTRILTNFKRAVGTLSKSRTSNPDGRGRPSYKFNAFFVLTEF